MKAALVLCALFFWLLHVPGPYIWFLAAGMAFYLGIRFMHEHVWLSLSVFMLLCLLLVPVHHQYEISQQKPQEGLYRITEIKRNGLVASNGRHQVLVQNWQQPAFDQIVYISSFEPVHSLNNSGLFHYAGWLRSRLVCWQAQPESVNLVRDTQSCRGKLFVLLAENRLARLLLYNLKEQAADSSETKPALDQESWIMNLGLPVSGFYYVLKKRLTRYTGSFWAFWISLFFLCLYGHFFCWSLSAARLIIFAVFSRIRSWPLRWPLQICSFLILFPWAYAEFTFVLPAVLSFGMHFYQGWKRKGLSAWILAVLQIVYFGKIDWISLAGFSLMRKLWGWIFGVGLVVILAEMIPGMQQVCKGSEDLLLQLCQWSLPGWSWQGTASIFIMILFAFCIVRMLMKPTAAALLLGAGTLVVYMLSFYADPFFHVYQLDIGQGDCCVIVEPFQKSVVMIDCAGSFSGSHARDLIIPFLQSRHLMRVDALVVTHGDQDHDGSRKELEALWPVHSITDSLGQGIPVEYPMYSLLPERTISVNAKGEEDENDKSLITWFAYDDFTYLWTGDASAEIEAQLIKSSRVQADILKAGHHGSKTSSSSVFLQAVQPAVALISAGYQNRYHHPSPETMTRLHSQGIDVLQTQIHGLIHLYSWRHWLFITCADGTTGVLTRQDIEKKRTVPSMSEDKIEPDSLQADPVY